MQPRDLRTRGARRPIGRKAPPLRDDVEILPMQGIVRVTLVWKSGRGNAE